MITTSNIILILALVFLHAQSDAQTVGDWTALNTTGAGPAPVAYSTAVVYNGNLIYTFGGYQESQVATTANVWYAKVNVFNTSSNTWSLLSPTGTAPSARGYHISFLRGDEMIVAFGGQFTSSFVLTSVNNDIWAYNITANSWRNISSGGILGFPQARLGPSAVYDTQSDTMYIFGGINTFYVSLADTWKYSFATGTWAQLTLMTNPSARYTTVTQLDTDRRQMIIYGGETVFTTDPSQQFFSAPTDMFWRFNITSETWSRITPNPDIPPRNNGNEAAYYSNLLLLHGGDIGGGVACGGALFAQNIVNETWSYSFTDNAWKQICPVHDIIGLKRATTILVGTNVYTYGGWNFDNPTCTGPTFNYNTYVFGLNTTATYGGSVCP